jgi:hypothetical protein
MNYWLFNDVILGAKKSLANREELITRLKEPSEAKKKKRIGCFWSKHKSAVDEVKLANILPYIIWM